MDQKINRLGVVNMDQIEVSSISVKKGIGRYWNIKKGEKLIINNKFLPLLSILINLLKID